MLTSAQVRDAKPRATRYELTCDAVPGFIVRVLPTGKKVAFARFRDEDGMDRRHRLGPLGPDLTVDDARRQAVVIITQRRVPEVIDAPGKAHDRSVGARSRASQALADAPDQVGLAPPSDSKPLTLRQFALRFDQEHIDMRVKPGTAKNHRYSLARYVLPVLGDRPPRKRHDRRYPAIPQQPAQDSLRRQQRALCHQRAVLEGDRAGRPHGRRRRWSCS